LRRGVITIKTGIDKVTPEFKSKIINSAQAAAVIESGDRIWATGLSATPIEFLVELCKRREELRDVELFTALLTEPFDFLKPEFRGHISNSSIFFGPLEKQAKALGNTVPYSYHLSEVPEALEYVHECNVLAITVTEPDQDGYMSMGPCGGIGCYAALQRAEKVIVSVNPKLPYVLGERNRIHASEATHIILTTADIPTAPSRQPTVIDQAIADRLLPYINDGDTLQIGIGGIPDALGYSLESKKDLGIHTEMLTDCIVHLAKIGVVNGRRKNHYPNKIVFSFAFGSQDLMDFVDRNDDLVILPGEETIATNEAARNDNFVSVNTCLMVDLTGQVAAESVGFTQISATGGQLPLVRAAKQSKGGRSFIALASARKNNERRESNIQLAFPPGTAVTTPRSDAQFIVTEYGVADMRQRSLEDRARSLIEIAHPDFRKSLLHDAQQVGLIRPDMS
jgi:4-hydroxybutyrate CoA-transferase